MATTKKMYVKGTLYDIRCDAANVDVTDTNEYFTGTDLETILDEIGFDLIERGNAPSSASDTGTAGEIRIDSSYIYYCTATNTWVRAALATW